MTDMDNMIGSCAYELLMSIGNCVKKFVLIILKIEKQKCGVFVIP